jgi:endonuclease-8
MPEGDTIFRAARTLQRALAGNTVTRFATGHAQLADVDRVAPIAGRTIDRVEAAGKHVLMTFSPPPLARHSGASDGAVAPRPPAAAKAEATDAAVDEPGSLAGGLVLRTHMRMNGSWHIYRPGEKWQMPARAMRILIETRDWVAVAFNVHVAEFVRATDLARHRPLATLGPDLLGDFDPDRALALIRAGGSRAVHEVLLDQRVMAGIGNVYKSEILFLSRIHPDTDAAAVTDEGWRELMTLAQSLLRANVADGASGIITYRGLRRTTGRMNPEDRLWIYSRGGRPCRRCGTPIASRKDGDAARVTYWCPSCQTLAATVA